MISEEILINVTPQETRIAVILDGQVQEIHIERKSAQGLVGNIYLGRIARVLPGMQSAFVDIGLSRTAFLHVGDVFQPKDNVQPHDPRLSLQVDMPVLPIEQMLHEGQTLLVQVIKDPIGTKGARLSTHISLAAPRLVYLPQSQHIGISQRIEDEITRNELKERLQALLPKDTEGGFIIRTNAETADDDALCADTTYLLKLWRDIVKQSQRVKAPIILYRDLDLPQRILRDFINKGVPRVIVDSREYFNTLVEFTENYMPILLDQLEYYTGSRPLFDIYDIDEEINQALSRKVPLKSGGYLIIDQTEAMTTIDVNTGAFVGSRSFADTIYKTNLEAAHVIARQLRLRNQGGLIIIDFIDMGNVTHQESVLQELHKVLEPDRTKITVSGFTVLGLVEMTRKRTRESLSQIFCEPCPTCSGRGEVKTAQTVCYEILRECLKTVKQFETRQLRVLASPEVVDLFSDEESQSLAMLEDFIQLPVSLHPDTGYTQEQYDIVLM